MGTVFIVASGATWHGLLSFCVYSRNMLLRTRLFTVLTPDAPESICRKLTGRCSYRDSNQALQRRLAATVRWPELLHLCRPSE